MAWKLAILTGALALALPSVAQGATYCVKAPGCEGEEHETLQDALNAADASAGGADRVELGPGAYKGRFTADDDNSVVVVGAGRGNTVLEAVGDGTTVVSLAAPASAVRGVSVRLGSGDTMGLAVENAEDVAIERAGSGAAATGFSGQTFKRGSVDLGPASDTTGVRLGSGTPSPLLENATVRAGTGVQVGPAPTDPVSATLRHVTMIGSGTGLSVTAAPGTSSVSATLSDSVIAGMATAIQASDGGCPAAPCTASVTTRYSAYDTGRVLASGPLASIVSGTPAPISTDPKLQDDLRPRYDSPLVDAGDPAAGGDVDAQGAPRVIDGDGNGTARRDIGAFEYQRRAPVISAATATPGGAAVAVPIAFSAGASDPDGETVSAAWSFSDGATATGFDVTHAFAAPGPAAAELTVSDAAGVTAKASVAVTIDAPPASPARPKPPSAIARVLPEAVKLRAKARRDRRPPYRFRLRGRVELPTGVSAAGCTGGRVRLTIRAGKRRLAKTALLRPDCSFRLTLRLGRKRARRVVVTPHFTGTPSLAPRDGTPLKLRAG